MSISHVEALLHPVRMGVVTALAGDSLTTKQIHARMPDVPQASLYRAVARLVQAGVLEVVSETQRGGAIERTYRARVAPTGLADASNPEAWVAAVEAMCSSASLDAARWAGALGAGWDPDSGLMRREVVYLTEDEFVQLRDKIGALIDDAASRPATDGAVPHAVAAMAVPRPE